MLHVEKRELCPPRSRDHDRKEGPDRGPFTEKKQYQAQAEEPDPDQRELQPENGPIVCRLARLRADAEVEEDGEQEGRGKPRPHQRRPQTDGLRPFRKRGHRRSVPLPQDRLARCLMRTAGRGFSDGESLWYEYSATC